MAAPIDLSDPYFEELTKTPFMRVLLTLQQVKKEPRLAVIIAHGFVELMTNTLIDHHCRNGKKITEDTRTYPHSTKLTILHEMSVISDHHFKLLNWFRKMRNEAAHEPFFEIKPQQLDIFAKKEHRNLKRFHMTCLLILLDFWTFHIPVLGAKLMHTPSRPRKHDEGGTVHEATIVVPLTSDLKRPIKKEAPAVVLPGPHSVTTV